MGLTSINRAGYVLKQAVRAIYRITPIKRTIESGLAFLQAKGHGDTTDADNQELLQEADVAHVQHFGFESFPWMSTATEMIVVDVDGGLCVIAEQHVLPSTLATLKEKEARLYGAEGQSVLCNESGDIECEPKAGRHTKIGNGATKALALDADDVNKDTSAPALDFGSWMASIEGLAEAGLGGVAVPKAATLAKIGTVVGSSTKGKGE